MKSFLKSTLSRYLFLAFMAYFFYLPTYAQCPLVEFSLPDTVCIGENIYIVNQSSTGVEYEWDFCAGGLHSSRTNFVRSSKFSGVNLSSGIDIVYDSLTSSWIGFTVQRQTGSLVSLNFGNSLDNNPVSRTVYSGFPLSNPHNLTIINEGGNWYVIVINDLSPFNIIKFNFGTTLTSLESVQNLGNAFGLLNNPRAINHTRNEKGELFLFISNFKDSEILALKFGLSINNQLLRNNIYSIQTNLSDNQIQDIDLIKSCDEWYAFFPVLSTGQLMKLNLGQSISIDNPIITEVLETGFSEFSFRIDHDGKGFMGFLMRRDGTLTTIDFGPSLSNGYEIVNSNNSINLEGGKKLKIIRDTKHQWKIFSLHVISDLYYSSFSSSCVDSIYTVNGREPKFKYKSAGDHYVSQKVIDQSGGVSYAYDSIHVRSQISPSVDFEIQNADRCVSSPVLFSANSSDESQIAKYIWDFGDGTISEGKETSHQYRKEGVYKVKLNIETHDQCNNFVEKEIVIFNELGFTTNSKVVCTNSMVSFLNSNTLPQADTIDWLWDFNGEGSSTEANPTFSFSSGGSKTVSLTASIPGCSNTYDTTFMVEQGPVVDFSTPPQICQGDEITFENLSSGENITGYRWSFGDGGTYSSTALESPSYVYDSAGTYIATLEVNNTIGCANTLSKTITIYARPQAAFTADIACAGAPTQFVDESTTGINSNVVAWEWDFGDGGDTAREGTAHGGSSQARNPQYTYALPGVYEATLVVLTSAGCTDTLSQEIIVESAVQADFSAQTLCPSVSDPFTVQFTDISTVNDAEEISEWLWTINGENFVIAEPAYTFEQPGTYQVSLTVFSATACNASVTKNITIATPPAPDFSFVANCAGQPVSFSNESLSEEVAISQYRWDFGGLGISYEENPAFVFEEAGSYQVSLSLETSEGCQYSVSQEVNVPAAPQASFTADVTYGGAPLTVNFSDTSTGADSVRWDFGGEATANEANPSHTFSDPGTYTVTLEALSDLGCTDTYSVTIEVVRPFSNLQLQRISLLSEEDDPNVRLLLTVRNLGNLTVSDFEVAMTLDEVLTITESFEGSIEPGEIINYPLDFTISSQLNQDIDLRYICVTLSALPDEEDITDNRTCLSLNNDFSVIAPYPNPSVEKIKVDMVLPQKEIVRFSLLTTKGELVENIVFNDTKAGLNTFNIDVSKMITGSYFLQVGYLDRTETYRLMVRP